MIFFLQLKEKINDGNLFLKEAFKKGASLAVVNKTNHTEKKIKQIKVKIHFEFFNKSIFNNKR